MRLVAAALGAALLSAVAPSAGALDRKGLLLGFGAGWGLIDCEGCDALGGFSFDVHIGGSLSPRWALLVESWGVNHELSDGTVLNSFTFTGNVQYQAAPRLWLRAGVGVGEGDVSFGDVTVSGDTGLALAGAAGFELKQGRRFALDLEAKASWVEHRGGGTTNAAVQLGFTWY